MLRATYAGALAVVVAGFCASAPAIAQTDIVDVRVQGNQMVEDRTVRSLFGLEPGDTFSLDDVRQGIVRLYSRDLFDDVRVEGEETGAGVVLTIIVVERPRVERVVFSGNDEISREDLEKETEQPHARTVSERAIFYDRQKIRGLYTEKGYRQAEVDVETEEISGGRQIVTYRIREGKKTRVRRVRIERNLALADKEVRSVLKTKKRRFWRGGDFKDDVFEEDLDRIRALYGEHGYLDATVVDHELNYDDEEGNLEVVFIVDEGPQYYMGQLGVEGNTLLEDERILELLNMEEGDIFNQAEYYQGLDAVYGAYSEEGYVYCRVEPRRYPQGERVGVDVHIEEGPRAYIRNIDVSGNLSTREKVVRRELVVRPGDVFKRSALMRSQREVFSLGFFEDVQLAPAGGSETGEMDLLFTVVERQTGQAMGGVGYSNQYGMTGSIQLAKTNFRGTGQTIDMMWEFGRLGQFRVGFTEPWLFDTPTSLGFQLYRIRRRRQGDAFAEKSAGGSVRIGRPFPWLDYARVYSQYRLEEWEIEAFADASETIASLAGTGTTTSLSMTLIRNSTDSPFFPTMGSISSASYEIAGVWRDSDSGALFQPYSKVMLGSQWFTKAFGPFVLAIQSRMGLLKGHSESEEVPIYEKFRLGGTMREGLRGYSDFEVVPEGNQQDDGGRVMAILTSELKFPIGGPQFFGLFFFDSGNTWNSVAEAQPATLKRGAGFGVRFQAPMIGVIGLDYGYGFDRDEAFGGPAWEWHFQLGAVQF